jgi:hypothetical protein
VEHLLPVKNGTWLEEGEPKMKRDQFVEKISLDSVTISTDEAFEFLYQDGGLFDGHAIVVRGSLKDGPETADIYG